ncbi:ParB N-terminal domain-containing protein (plasmid) [Paraclostridium ghonii]|uniref:ParB N-terminal domain-containing protein n=1 Tax=Paraclostridium ghonii TaxID=29358 RepID=UPI003524D981
MIKNAFTIDYDITNLNPADYNPRKINEQGFEALKRSIKRFGIVKPVILNGKNNVLTAGHQRTKASKAIGITNIPAIIIHKDIPMVDEVRFNLFHNSIETNISKTIIEDADKLPFCYSFVSWDKIRPIEYKNPEVLKEISKLCIKYGEWGSVIIDEYGNIIQNSEYANAIHNLKYGLLVYKMKNDDVVDFLDICENNEFGEYNYEALGIKSYNQLYCQMNRVVGVVQKSALYEKVILKEIEKDDRIIDFGAGKCGYINSLKDKGYKAFAYEPHFKKDGKPTIDIKSVVKMIKIAEIDIKKNALYDKVVLDSVINSVTSLEFEDMVLTTCNALLKSDGVFYCATRDIKAVKRKTNENKKSAIDKNRYTEFLDKDGFSATFRNGVWTMQRFHTVESFTDTLKKYFEVVEHISHNGSAMQIRCKKPINLPIEHYEKSLNIEFNMEYPNNYRHNQHEKIVQAIISELKNRCV